MSTLKQYYELKAKHPEALLLFRCGDFYECYKDDALNAAKVLGSLAGFPYHALDTFNEEYNHEWNKRQYPRLKDRLEQYFRGLPSVIHIEFRDYYIAEIGKSWGYDSAVKNGRFVNNWFHRCAERLLQLARKFDIDTTFLG